MDPSEGRKTNVSFDVEDLSIEDIDEMLRKHNEKHPEDSPGAGVFKHVSMLEKKLQKKKKK